MKTPSAARAYGYLIAAAVWLVILGGVAVAYRLFIRPQLAQTLNAATSGRNPYQFEFNLGADGFSGYAPFRSAAFREDLKQRGISVRVINDSGDVDARLEALRIGELQMAAMPLDALLSRGAKSGFPASIVWVIDESQGADAVLTRDAYVHSLNEFTFPDAQLVFAAGSSSEFLATMAGAQFNLPRTGASGLTPRSTPQAVLREMPAPGTTDHRAYVLREPFVSQSLEVPGTHVVLDSRQIRGPIFDVLVARREFLQAHPEIVEVVLEAEARVLWQCSRAPDGWSRLIREDGERLGTALTDTQAQRIVGGIRWQNVLDNLVHFGLLSASERNIAPGLDDLIGEVTDTLRRTRLLSADPLSVRRNALYFDRPLAALQARHFHPDRRAAPPANAAPTPNSSDAVRDDTELIALSDDEWQRLRPVGGFPVGGITFARASASLSIDGERTVIEMTGELNRSPRCYLQVIGHARPDGDPAANRILAQARADTVVRAFAKAGVAPGRLRSHVELSAPAQAGAQSVTLVVGQIAY